MLACIQLFIPILFKHDVMVDTIDLELHFYTGLIDFGLNSRSQECNKAKMYAAFISNQFGWNVLNC